MLMIGGMWKKNSSTWSEADIVSRETNMWERCLSILGLKLRGHHHITMATGNPQEDFDFHTKVPGLKCVKRTLFYDSAVPVYHLY